MYMYTSYIPDFLIYKENVSLKGVLFKKKNCLCKSYLQRLLAVKQDANSIPFFFSCWLTLKIKVHTCTLQRISQALCTPLRVPIVGYLLVIGGDMNNKSDISASGHLSKDF